MTRLSTRLKEAPRPSAPQKEEPGYRILPHNMEAEQGLLGALLVDNRAMEKIGDFLRGDHFFIPAQPPVAVPHTTIAEAVRVSTERRATMPPVVLADDAKIARLHSARRLAHSGEQPGNAVSIGNAI